MAISSVKNKLNPFKNRRGTHEVFLSPDIGVDQRAELKTTFLKLKILRNLQRFLDGLKKCQNSRG